MDTGSCTLYDRNNREERALCSHLFRLLLNSQHADPEARFFRAFLKLFSNGALTNNPAIERLRLLEAKDARYARVYSEVTVARDLLASDRSFQSTLSTFCRKQDGATVRWEERQVLCTKPDLAVVAGGALLVIEAKFTLGFDKQQLDRTASLVSAWQEMESPMRALGLEPSAPSCLATLGGRAFGPHVSWEDVLAVASESFASDDPSLLALSRACDLLPRKADVDDVDRMSDFVPLKGLTALAAYASSHPGGHVGFVGGMDALCSNLDNLEYLRTRSYKWVPSVDLNRHQAKNWLSVESFLATLIGQFATNIQES